MHEQIITRDHIRAKARAAFNRGDSRDSHSMNPLAPALTDWLAEYDRCAAEARAQVRELAEAES